MEKTIKLKMKVNKDLVILINDEEKHKIISTDRSITADKIYEILNYSKGDRFVVTSECENNTDSQVLEFFKDILISIINKINELTIIENDEPDF